MRISMTLLAVGLALACGVVQAQTYRWVDQDGKVRYGDVPPPGIKANALKAPPPAPSSSSDKQGSSKNAALKDAKKGPLTPAEQEQAYRERQAKSKEEQEKAEKDLELAEQRKQNCVSAQESLRTLESGRRVSSLNAKGETEYLDEAQLAERIAKARKVAADSCK